MLSRQKFFRTAAAVALVGVALAGCGQLRPSQKIDIYDATLSGAQEVPPATTSATGVAEVQLNTNTNTLKWKVTYSGLTGPATGGHIHGPAEAGQNAGVVIPFTTDLNAQPITGQANLSPQQAAQLAAGQWYVNIHTARYPGGEIRGQLRLRR